MKLLFSQSQKRRFQLYVRNPKVPFRKTFPTTTTKKKEKEMKKKKKRKKKKKSRKKKKNKKKKKKITKSDARTR